MPLAFPQPDLRVLERRDIILQGLAQLVAPEALITSEDERRAFETDALTAYRKMPLAVVWRQGQLLDPRGQGRRCEQPGAGGCRAPRSMRVAGGSTGRRGSPPD